MWNGWMHGGGFGLGMLGMTLVWVVLAIVLVLVVRAIVDRSPTRREADGSARESPLEILQRRYAKGEIDRAEFEEKRRDLS